MDFLLEALTNWLKEMLVGGIMSNLSGMFDREQPGEQRYKNHTNNGYTSTGHKLLHALRFCLC